MARVHKHPFHNVRFTQIPTELLRDPGLPDRAKALYGYMASHSEQWELSIKSMTKNLNRSRNTIKAALRELEDAGWVTSRRRVGANGEDRASDYWMQVAPVRSGGRDSVVNPDGEGGQNVTPGGQNLTRGGSKSDPSRGSKSDPLRRSREDQSLEDPPYAPRVDAAAGEGCAARGAAVCEPEDEAQLPLEETGGADGIEDAPPQDDAPPLPVPLPATTQQAHTPRSRPHTGTSTPAPVSSPTRGGYSAAFEQWWADYPRKVGKRAAYSAYQRATKRDGTTAVHDGLTAWKTHGIPDDPRYIPHPATWLNQGRYDDDHTPPPARMSTVDRKGLGYMAIAQRLTEGGDPWTSSTSLPPATPY